jgi:hypothetical protein
MIMVTTTTIFGVERFLALVVICYITHYTIWLQSLMIIKVTFVCIGTGVAAVVIVLRLRMMVVHQVRVRCRQLGILDDVVVALRFALDFHASQRLRLRGAVCLGRCHRGGRVGLFVGALRRVGAAVLLLLLLLLLLERFLNDKKGAL